MTLSDSTIVINSVRIPLGLFLIMEPSHRMPVDSHSQIYVQGQGRLINQKGSSYRIAGSWDDGDRYISREREFSSALMSENLEYAEALRQVRMIRESTLGHGDRRKAEYPPINDLVVALWKHLVEGKDFDASGITSLQNSRESVNSKYRDWETDRKSTRLNSSH